MVMTSRYQYIERRLLIWWRHCTTSLRSYHCSVALSL